MSARTRFFTGPIRGRTHRSAPTRWGKRSGDNGNWRGKRTFPLRGDERAARRGRRALRVVAESRRDCPGQRRTAERLCQRSQGNGRETEQKSPPRCPATPDNPSVSLRLTAPCAPGSLSPRGTEDADCRVAPLLAMTVLIFCHSEEAQRADVGIRPFYDGRGVRAAEVVGPYGRSTEVPATGRCRHRPLRKAQSSTTQTSRRAAKRPRPRPRGMGGNRRKNHPKRGPPPRPPGQRLAKRNARKEQLVKFGLCPMTSECSTAYYVRRFQQGPARALVGATLTE